jgi:hypothetical protein
LASVGVLFIVMPHTPYSENGCCDGIESIVRTYHGVVALGVLVTENFKQSPVAARATPTHSNAPTNPCPRMMM